MTWQPRKESASGVYHVVSRGAGRRILFEDDEDRRFYLDGLVERKDRFKVVVLVWCLMDNHVHMLVRCELADLARLMRSLNTAYARRYNGRHGHVGPVFQGRYASFPVEGDAYLMELVRYIHMNPQHGGIARYDAYGWSSYAEYTGRPAICETGFVLGVFGGLPQFVAFHEGGPDAEEELAFKVEGGQVAIRRMAIPDGEAAEMARRMFGDEFANSIASMPREERNAALRRLRGLGLSVRQVERLTGVGRGVIQKL
jgi:REP element-mobilizing transposase RayT